MITPQTNTTLETIAQVIRDHESFAVCGHVNPDGDCLGSQLALVSALKTMGKDVVGLLAKDDPIDRNLRFLPGLDNLIFADNYEGTPDVFIAVDVPTVERLGNAGAVHDRAAVTITIDHHRNDTSMAQYNYVDPDAAAACILIWELLGYLDVRNEEVALDTLTGLITDTGRFSYQNTDSHAFKAAAEMVSYGASPALVTREFFQNRSEASIALEQRMLERRTYATNTEFVYSHLLKSDFEECSAIKADAEALIDTLRSIAGVRVALILRENEQGEIRGSLRAKDDTDVAQVARHFGGGGHKAAAGFTFKGSIEEALKEVPRVVIAMCFAQGDHA